MIPEEDTPFHVRNPGKIKRKYGGVVVSEPVKMSSTSSLRSICLWTTLTPLHIVIIK